AAAEGAEGVKTGAGQGAAHRIGARVALVGAGADRAEDGPAPGQRAPEPVHGHGLDVVLDRAPPAVADAEHLVVVDALALADHGPHDRVEPGTVAAPGEHRHTHGRTVPN